MTSVEMAEKLYDGGGDEEAEHKEWFEGRLRELMTSKTAVFDALDDGQLIELLEVLLNKLTDPRSDLRIVLGAMEQYLDHVVYIEETKGAYDNWKLAKRDDYREEA